MKIAIELLEQIDTFRRTVMESTLFSPEAKIILGEELLVNFPHVYLLGNSPKTHEICRNLLLNMIETLKNGITKTEEIRTTESPEEDVQLKGTSKGKQLSTKTVDKRKS